MASNGERSSQGLMSPPLKSPAIPATPKGNQTPRQRIQDDASRSSSPEPPVLSISEAHANTGDEYGVAAALEMAIPDEAPPLKSNESLSSDKETDSLDPGNVQGEDPNVPEAIDQSFASSRMDKKDDESLESTPSLETHKLNKFSLYETQTRYFIVGADISNSRYRVLKIDRTAPPKQLSIVEDEIIYTSREISTLLRTIDDGNRAVGGLKHKTTSWGLIGFIRFTEGYYMLMVTAKKQVATIGGHAIYQVDGTGIVPLLSNSVSRFTGTRNAEESRFLSILNNLGLTRSFYFSTSYNVTRTLQHNIIRDRHKIYEGRPLVSQLEDLKDMFVWNQHLLNPALETLKNPFHWCIPIIHGFIDQSCLNVFGRQLYITIIARRSRFFAGARFLKRGANDLGYVANDVETEQIVGDMIVTSYHSTSHRDLKVPNYTSFVQHRGSIPLYWTQDSSGVSPKPAIDINVIDPFYTSAALHFDNLFDRYSAPIYVLNLIKARERMPRESKLLHEYQNAINYLNQQLPEAKRIKYRAFDMSRASKSRDQDVIMTLEDIAEDSIRTTGFFKNASQPTESDPCVQNGVVRSNCIDCLDRTNAAQFVIGKRALAYQLQSLGVITETTLNYDNDATNIYAHMFNDHGDTLASQYGGSHLVNTMDSYRKINNWQSQSRDMLESFKRYYHNSFLDNQRQEAYNLFLGNYIYAQGQPMLWELPNDHYLHHTNPNIKRKRRHYIRWFTPKHLEVVTLPPAPRPAAGQGRDLADDWWQEYYRPSIMTSFGKNFAYNVNSTRKIHHSKDYELHHDPSPFAIRQPTPDPQPESRKRGDPINARKPVNIADSQSREVLSPLSATSPPQQLDKRISSLQHWLNLGPSTDRKRSTDHAGAGDKHEMLDPAVKMTTPVSSTFKPADKAMMHQWTIRQFYDNTLNPSITDAEAAPYDKYADFGSREPHVSEQGEAAYASFVESLAEVQVGDTLSAAKGDEYERWLNVEERSFLAVEKDTEKKRHLAYENYLKGKSLFRQSKGEVDGKG